MRLPCSNNKEKADEFFEDKISHEINNIINGIAGDNIDILDKNRDLLNLVIQTDVTWVYSYPNENNCNVRNYDYLKKYAELLKTSKVKWTPVLHIEYPPFCLDKYTKEVGGHAMPFPYDSAAWLEAEKWIDGFILNLKEYIGTGGDNVIEEIFISNEMMFQKTAVTSAEKREDLKKLLIKLRRFVLNSLKNNGVSVPVGWKFADVTAISDEERKNRGLTDDILKELFSHDENDGIYTTPDIIGLNLYEGIPKDKCANITTRHKDYEDEKVGFSGKIYYTEYNSLSEDKYKDDPGPGQHGKRMTFKVLTIPCPEIRYSILL